MCVYKCVRIFSTKSSVYMLLNNHGSQLNLNLAIATNPAVIRRTRFTLYIARLKVEFRSALLSGAVLLFFFLVFSIRVIYKLCIKVIKKKKKNSGKFQTSFDHFHANSG